MATKHLLFLDLETTALDMERDRILEISAWLVDLDLSVKSQRHYVLALSSVAERRLEENDFTRNMHTENGLIEECKRSQFSLGEAESSLIEWLNLWTKPKEVSIAGSGVLAFDLPWLERWMPRVHEHLTYYGYDVGVFRRMTQLFNGGEPVIAPVLASFADGYKAHRTEGDVTAHLEEFKAFRIWQNGSIE